jgi:hypothetical protein
MKTILLTISTLLSLNVFAGVITCSNNPNSPGQYTSLQDAVDNSQPNDTILVHGSNTSYGNIIINDKAIVIIGAGIDPEVGAFTQIYQIDFKRVNSTSSSSGSKIYGCKLGLVKYSAIHSLPGGNKTLSDISIERCEFTYTTSSNFNIQFATTGTGLYDGIRFLNNVFLGAKSFDGGAVLTVSNIRFENNVFSGNQMKLPNIGDASSMLFKNNLFLNTYVYASPSYEIIAGPVFENNIVIGNQGIRNVNNCTLNNNLSYLCVNDTLIPSPKGSVGFGNIITQDPLFVNSQINSGMFTFDYANNYHLLSTSPALTSGAGGDQMGIYGGWYPLDPNSKPVIPQMDYITTPLGVVVSQGTNLNVIFKSYKQD